MTKEQPVAIIVMGTQGTGKSTIGRLLAEHLGVPFFDGDDLHPARNVELMAAGTPLTDEDREPWLHTVGETLASQQAAGGAVIACSALKRRYRDLLRSHVPQAYIVEPHGPIELVAERVNARHHQYMPSSLLASQYAALEPLGADELGVRVSVEPSPEDIVRTVLAHYGSPSGEHR